MKNIDRGYTIVELTLVIIWLAMMGTAAWVVVLIIRALLKYING